MEINEYDDVVNDVPDQTPNAPVNEYDEIVNDADEQQTDIIKTTLSQAAKKDPVRSKDVLNIAKDKNLPTSAVDLRLDDIKAKDTADSFNYDELIRINPKLSKWLENPDHAAVSHKEIEPLKRVERAAFKIRHNKKEERFTKQLDSALYTGWNQLNSSAQFVMSAYGVGNNKDIAANISENFIKNRDLRKKKPEFSKDFDTEMSSDVADIDEGFTQFLNSYEEIKNGNILDALKDFGIGGAKTVGETLELIGSAVIRPKGLIYSSTESLANSFPSLITGFAGMKAGAVIGGASGSVIPGAGTAAGATVGGAIGFGAGTFAGSVLTEIGGAISEDLSNMGIDLSDPVAVEKVLNDKKFMQTVIERAKRKGMTTAAVDGLFNMFAGKAFAGVKQTAKATGKKASKVAIAKAVTKDVGVDMIGEGTGEFAGQIAKEKGLAGASIGQSILEGTVSLGSSVNDVLIGAANKTRELYVDDPIVATEQLVGDAQNAIESLQEIEAVNDLSIAIKEAKNTSEAKDAIRNLVESVDNDGEASAVYFQADDWDTYWTSQGESPVNKAYEISDEVGKSYAQASAIGSDMEIPVGDYAETIAKTDNADGLLNSVKTRSDGMNVNQANETLNTLPSMMKTLSEEANKIQDEGFINSAKEVKSRVKDQLKLAGMSDKDAEVQAQIYEGRAKTKALLRGEDPLELFRKQNLEIRKSGQQVVRDNTSYDEILKNRKLRKAANKKSGSPELGVEQLQGEALQLANESIDIEIDQMIYEISQSEKGSKIFQDAEYGGEPIVSMQESTFPIWYREIQAKNKKSFKDSALSKKGAVYNRIKTVAIERMKNGYSNQHSGPVEPDQVFRELLGMKEDEASEFDLFQKEDLTETKEFKKWFGDSKVVDEDGNPVVVHHGGMGADSIKIFSKDFAGTTTGNNEHGAFHFVDSTEVADDYGRQSFIRRYQDNPEGLVEDGVVKELPDFGEVDQYGYVEELAEENIERVDTYLKMENPLIIDRDYSQVDIQQIEDATKFAMTGEDSGGEMYEMFEDQITGSFEESDIEDYKGDIQLRAMENSDLEDIEDIEDHQFEEATREILEENGIYQEHPEFDGIIIKNMMDDIGDASKVYADQYIVFESNQIKSVENKGEFSEQDDNIYFQGGKNDPKGKIGIGKNFFRIDLLAKADPSTFLHETGHLFLEEMREDFVFAMAQGENQTDIQKKFLEDGNAILEHLGVKSFNDIKTEHHELFARSFETYLMEGKAPTKELQTAFSRFRAWLVTVYRSLKNVNAPLTDEVRGVMDRLLATEDEINAAKKAQGIKSLITASMKSKVDKKKLKTYEDLRDLFDRDAKDKMSINLAKSWKQEQKLFLSEEGKRIKKEVKEDLETKRPYKALDIFKNGLIEGEKIRINKGDLVGLFGAEVVKTLPKVMYSSTGGMLPNVVADIMGYKDISEMVKEITAAPPINEAAKAITEDRLRDQNKELLLSDKKLESLAQKFIHSDKRSEVLMMELSILSDIEKVNMEEGVRKSTRRIPTNEEIKKEASATLSGMQMKSIRPHLYQRAEVREARKVEEFIGKGNWAEAFEAKQKELLNHALYRQAIEVKEKQIKSIKKFKQLNKADTKLSKTRDMTFINTARSILSKFDLAGKPEAALANMQLIEKYDPDVFAMVSSIINSVDIEDKNYKELTLEQFTEINDIFDTLWDLSKSSKQIDIDGKKVATEDIVSEMVEASKIFIKEVPKAKYTKEKDKFTKIKEAIMSQVAKSRRIEHWVELMDMGNIKGVFRKAIFTPLSEATDRYYEDRDIYTKKIIAAANKLKEKVPEVKKNQIIQADELGHEFSNVGQVVGAIIHTGNESNFKKLLIGRGWGTLNEDGSLNTSKWDAFMQRMFREGIITDSHYDFAQDIWNLTDEIKPMVQKAHKQVYGHYFNEITFNEVKTPSGKIYKGGYVPAKVDYDIVKDAGKRDNLQDIIEGSPSFSLPGAGGNGFGKSRQENYNKALNLDINMVAQHVDEVIRFAHVKPAVNNAVKIVKNEEFKAMMEDIDPSLIDNMIVPAIIRADKNKTTDIPSGRLGIAMHVGNTIKKNVSAALFFGHIRNIVEQAGNMAVALSKDGLDAKDLAHGAMSILKNRKEVQKAIYDKSTFMRKKVNTEIFDNNKKINNLFKEKHAYFKMRDFAQENAYIGQNTLQTFQDEVLWIGAYDKAVQQGLGEKASIRTADSLIRTTQNGNRPLDISKLEGDPMLKMVQMFMGFFNNMANVNVTNMQKIYYSDLGAKEKTGKALYAYLTGYASIAIVSAALRKVAAGGLDEDEDDMIMDDLYEVFIASQFELGLAMMPLIGPAIQAGMNRGNEKFYDNKIGSSPVFEAIASVADYSIPDIFSDKTLSERIKAREALTVLSVVTGLPIAPLAKPIRYLGDVNSGKAEPSGPIDYTRGLITGKKGVK